MLRRTLFTLHLNPKKKVVVLGSGWGGFNFVKRIDMNKFDVSLVSPTNHFLFTPLLPSCAVGTLEFRAIQEPVRTIPGLQYYQGKAMTYCPDTRKIICRDIFKEKDFELDYDFLIVTCGSKTSDFNTPGVMEREGNDVLFLKHLHHARQVRNRILECFERAAIPSTSEADRARLLSFVVVGGGPTSCEFVGELYDFISEDCGRWYPDLKSKTRVTLVEAGSQILGSFHKNLSNYVVKRFKNRKIDVKIGTAVTKIEGNSAHLSDGGKLPFGMMVWSAGLQPTKFINSLDFEKGPTGRILTDSHLRVKGNERVFAFGDCAVMEDQPLPPIAQAALQEAKYLAKKFNACQPGFGPLSDEGKKPFSYMSLGSMAMLGGWRAVADFSHVGSPGKQSNIGSVTGKTAFLLWRTAYWGRQVSLVNKILIPMYWFKAWLFGRDISRF
eukprot:TRINITY_DN10484_c0_g1_i1.p1 TRINITY_DN10484_c0_g1~~TRINITY_DN10484_c0_g1_i1.p1  ORF type:complete len:453 (+),score=63.81 TRINITY_DN10484_c0_g1_i1:41-1360(+)